MIPGTVSDTARAKVRARAEAQMTAQVRVLRGNLGTLDPVTGVVGGIAGSTTIYAGKARVHTIVGQGSIAVGSGQVDQRQTVISIPWNVSPGPQQDDLVLVDADTLADLDVTGEAFRVLEVSGGTLFGAVTQMTCTAWHGSRYWAEP